MNANEIDMYYGFIAGTRGTHLERPEGGLVCNTRLYKKDHAMRSTVLNPDSLHLYVEYTADDFVCGECAMFANDYCECDDCQMQRHGLDAL